MTVRVIHEAQTESVSISTLTRVAPDPTSALVVFLMGCTVLKSGKSDACGSRFILKPTGYPVRSFGLRYAM